MRNQVTSIFLLSDGLDENAQDGIAKSLFHSELFDDLDNSNFSISRQTAAANDNLSHFPYN